MKSLRLDDYADRELLRVVHDCQYEGWATTALIAETLGLEGDNANQSVGIRLAWLKRYGVIDYQRPGRWCVSDTGVSFLNGDLTAAQKRQLDRLDGAQFVLATRRLADGYQHGDLSAAHLMRREWRRGVELRRRTE